MPKQSQSWKVVETARPEHEAMQLALGKAISAWARIEGALCWLFAHSANPGWTSTGSEVFSEVKSHEVRLAITDAAFRSKHQNKSDALTTWKDLKKRVSSAQKIRSKLAHAQIVTITSENDTKVWLVPFHFMETHKGFEAFEHHTLAQVEHYSRMFVDLAVEIKKLDHTLRWGTKQTA